jgi:phospholipid/cholesterol/gamma-HCH transport system substrate-binding protein
MQSLKSRKPLRSPITWGVGGIVFAMVVAVVLAYIYYSPPGEGKIVTFYTDDAVSISPGDNVRMAGIKVGSVKDVSLEAKRVRVRARVKDDAFVGDQSQVQVRMLTVVGGYYVNIDSMGGKPLGAEPIPLERVTMPYSLIRALTDTTKITDDVDTKPINQSLNEIQKGLTGTNVEAVSAIIDAGNSIMSTIDRQRGQITDILQVTDEYVRALTAYRGEIAQLVRKISIGIQTLELYSRGVKNLIGGLGQVLTDLRPVEEFYNNHRSEFFDKVRHDIDETKTFVERNGVAERFLQRVLNLFDRVLSAQQARPGLLATDLCFPTPGSPC